MKASGSILLLMWVAAPVLAAGDPVAGKEKSALCQTCHGQNGVSASGDIPNLAGQFAPYIEKQLMDFQMQNRNDSRMSPIANTVSQAKDAQDIAAYFATQQSMKSTPSRGAVGATQREMGRKLFTEGDARRGINACAGCHGETGKGKAGNNPLFPVIGGQHKAYIEKQLNDFKTSKRATDQSGIMEGLAKAMTKEEIEAVAEYAASW